MSEQGFEWVKPSTKPTQQRKGYWRRRPNHRDNPTLPMRKLQYTVAKAAHEEGTGKTGKIVHKGKEIPASCEPVIRNTTGKKFAPEKPRHIPEILDRLTPFLTSIGQSVQGFRVVNREIVPRLLLWQREHEKRQAEEKILKKQTS